MTAAAGVLLALACTAAGIGLLQAAWSRRGGGWRVAAGWAALAASIAAWRLTGAAWDKATALAALCVGLAGLAAAAACADVVRRGAGRVREAREAEPPPRGAAPWRTAVRIVCAGPVALGAALGCAALAGLHGPGDGADRVVAAGFLLPTLWAAAGVWATTDDRLGRVGLTLGAVAALAFAAAAATTP